VRKIPSLFQRNYEGDNLVREEVVPGSEWVLAGEGVATRKYDGTCCLVKEGKLFKRYDAKKGKTPPEGFVPAQDPDPITGHYPGWIPVGEGAEDKWHREGLEITTSRYGTNTLPDGTYELIGQKVNGNPEAFPGHLLIRHGERNCFGVGRNFEDIKEFLRTYRHMEGIVWHHPDGRMVKIKRKDFFKKGERG